MMAQMYNYRPGGDEDGGVFSTPELPCAFKGNISTGQ